jgi:hypothetical protein
MEPGMTTSVNIYRLPAAQDGQGVDRVRSLQHAVTQIGHHVCDRGADLRVVLDHQDLLTLT